MKRKTIILLCLAALAMSGCKSLYGRYERPDVYADGLYRDSVLSDDTLTAGDTLSFGNLSWRSVFTDPQLQAIIVHGLDNNYDLCNAILNVQMTEQQLKAARLAFLPSLSIAPDGTVASFDGSDAILSYNLPVSASWNVDLFGGLLSQKRAAQMLLLQSEDYKSAVRSKVICGIANLYYTLLMLDKQKELAAEMEKLTQNTWNVMKEQMNYGLGVHITAVQAAESNYLSVQTKRLDIDRQIRETENALSLLLGERPQAVLRGKLENQSLPAQFSTGVSVQILNNRPDVHAKEMALAQCFYNVETARSRFYPNLNLTANGIFSNKSGMAVTNPGKWLLTAVASLVQPVFANGRLIAGLKVSEAQYKQAYNDWQSTVLGAGSEVSNALVQYNIASQKSEKEARQIDILKKNVVATQELMGMTRTTYLEVISAQSNLLNAELAKVADDFAKMQAVVNLYSALGGGAHD